MSTIFINGLNSKTGGGKSILSNLLTFLGKDKSKNNFIVLTPNKSEFQHYSNNFVKIVDINNIYKNNFLLPFVNCFLIPRLLKEHNADAILNLGDIVIPTSIRQVYLFDWAYAVYPDSIAWQKMDLKDYFTRKIKLSFFKKYIKRAAIVIAQTETMRVRLNSVYGLKNVEVIPNVVSLDNVSGGRFFDFNFPKKKTKLLYLTYYYTHKNIEILLPLARKIKNKSLPYCIVVTIDRCQHKNAMQFLDVVEQEGLDSVIVNVGPVKMEYVPSLFAQTDALLMPTLLESYGLPYIEAMHHNKTVFTSNFDFATDVCGDVAFYFDPLDTNSILDSIVFAFENNKLRAEKIEKGKQKIASLLSWEQTFNKYIFLLDKKSV
jgi:glycosyltransferase involved in cell wall biosynthesis